MNLSYEYNEYSNPFDRGTVFTNGHPADIDYDKRLDEPWAKSVGIRETATARFEYELSEDWKTRVTYGWNNDRYSLSIAQPSLSKPVFFSGPPTVLITTTKLVTPVGISWVSRSCSVSVMTC